MPTLNVSRVLLSREFVDKTLVCVRSAQVVGNDGRATNTPTSTTFAGVVTSADGSVLTRRDDGSYLTGSITIHSRFLLSAGLAGQDADVVQWRGYRFTVTQVSNYSTYGAGFTAATCVPIPLAGT